MIKEAPVMLITNPFDQILLLRRTSEHKLFPNEWCLPGGKRDWIQRSRVTNMGPINTSEEVYIETLEQCIFRECIEELGAKIYVFKNTGIVMMDEYYQMPVFLALTSYVSITKEFPNREHVEYNWFDKRRLPENLSHVTLELIQNFDF